MSSFKEQCLYIAWTDQALAYGEYSKSQMRTPPVVRWSVLSVPRKLVSIPTEDFSWGKSFFTQRGMANDTTQCPLFINELVK